ncbi:putative spermidine/putrescine transport system permease protein [Rhizobium azooxidifex]|uniref:Putative spermidine/putrescine transport system permease protein n=1 Tax=Mycoplana azooxidifex TaxID=1636188 RepID=A0A7W6DG05_9HYPH|nr:ABC transporter permease [Mycoplana azooxidifex]MBB3979138.1 putative spermidine/putrescine transport system permease protein [Mycoplana azooxidifex]
MTETVSPAIRIVVAIILLMVVAPLVVPLLMSISDTAFIVFPPQGFTLKWYAAVLANPEARGSFLFSLELAAIVTTVSLVLGIPCAAGLTRFKVPGQDIMLGIILSPLIVPLIVTGIALLQFFSMMNFRATLLQLVIGHTVVCLPYVIRSVSASFVLANRNLEDAAAVLGAPPHVVATRIVWPQVRPGILAGGVFCFIVSFDDYPISMWLADGNHFPIPLYLYTVIERSFDPSIAAIASLMIFFALLLVLVIERVFGINLARLAS